MKKWQILEFDGKPYYAFIPEEDAPLIDVDDEDAQMRTEDSSYEEPESHADEEENDVRTPSRTKKEQFFKEEVPCYDSIEEKLQEVFNENYDEGKPILLNGEAIDNENNEFYQLKVQGNNVIIEKLLSTKEEDHQTENASDDEGEVEYLEEELVSNSLDDNVISVQSSSKSESVKCKLCSETFVTEISCRKHVAWVHKKQKCIKDNGSFLCAVCDYSTTKKAQFVTHLERNHEIWSRKRSMKRLFPCTVCGFTCRSKHSLQSHFIRKHTDKYEYQCTFCSKKFKVKGDLTNHVRFHHKEKPVKCDVCGKMCQNSSSLYVHQKWAHFKPKFECHICHRRMVTQENLDQHLKTQHEKRDKIVCAECGKTFTKKDSFKRHMVVHTGCKPHSCIICSKPFARRSQLRQHLLIHTGKRPFVCDICGKAFTQKPGLICHRKTHPGTHPPLPVMPIGDIVKEFTEGYAQENESNAFENEEEKIDEEA